VTSSATPHPAHSVLPALAAKATHETLPETVIAFAVLDGLLEAIEWANEGVAADEPACMWLSTLRWTRTLDGSVPEGAPEPPSRWTDDHFRAIARGLTPEQRTIVNEHADIQTLRGPEMGTPSRPFAKKRLPDHEYQNDDAARLALRSFILGLLPDADGTLTNRLTRDAAALTHGAEASYFYAQSVGRWANAQLWPDAHSAAEDTTEAPELGPFETQVKTAVSEVREPSGGVERPENSATEALLELGNELAQRWAKATS